MGFKALLWWLCLWFVGGLLLSAVWPWALLWLISAIILLLSPILIPSRLYHYLLVVLSLTLLLFFSPLTLLSLTLFLLLTILTVLLTFRNLHRILTWVIPREAFLLALTFYVLILRSNLLWLLMLWHGGWELDFLVFGEVWVFLFFCHDSSLVYLGKYYVDYMKIWKNMIKGNTVGLSICMV